MQQLLKGAFDDLQVTESFLYLAERVAKKLHKDPSKQDIDELNK